MDEIRQPFGLSDNYWSRLSAEHQAMYGVVRPLPTAAYTVHWHIGMLEETVAGIERDMLEIQGSFELEPDFQRGHVWTDAQRVAYVESLIRKTAPVKLLFNCPGWTRTEACDGDIPANTFQCIDGLQRLTAVRKFMAGEFRVFDRYFAADLKASPFDLARYRMSVEVFEFNRRADLLQFYIDLNSGGTVHAPSEIERVRGLIASPQVAAKA